MDLPCILAWWILIIVKQNWPKFVFVFLPICIKHHQFIYSNVLTTRKKQLLLISKHKQLCPEKEHNTYISEFD